MAESAQWSVEIKVIFLFRMQKIYQVFIVLFELSPFIQFNVFKVSMAFHLKLLLFHQLCKQHRPMLGTPLYRQCLLLRPILKLFKRSLSSIVLRIFFDKIEKYSDSNVYLLIGIIDSAVSRAVSVSYIDCENRVLMIPGATQLTRIFSGAKSWLNAFVSPNRAVLLTEYAPSN